MNREGPRVRDPSSTAYQPFLDLLPLQPFALLLLFFDLLALGAHFGGV